MFNPYYGTKKAQKALSKARFEQSEPLRNHICTRLRKMADTLLEEHERVNELIDLAQEGAASATPKSKGPGDE